MAIVACRWRAFPIFLHLCSSDFAQFAASSTILTKRCPMAEFSWWNFNGNLDSIFREVKKGLQLIRRCVVLIGCQTPARSSSCDYVRDVTDAAQKGRSCVASCCVLCESVSFPTHAAERQRNGNNSIKTICGCDKVMKRCSCERDGGRWCAVPHGRPFPGCPAVVEN